MQSIIPVTIDIAPPSYNYVIDYWKKNYTFKEEEVGIYQWFCCKECDALYTISFGNDAAIKKFSEMFVCDDYHLSNWCEQDFQDILSPTLNELVLFELKYGFDFPFQEKNMKHPIMVTIYPRTTE